jgi:hypothetical protein
MVLYAVFATDRLEAGDRALLVQGLGNSPASMHQPTVEAAIAAAGFEVRRRERIGSEWTEHQLERDPGDLTQDLLEVARLTRHRERMEAALGPADPPRPARAGAVRAGQGLTGRPRRPSRSGESAGCGSAGSYGPGAGGRCRWRVPPGCRRPTDAERERGEHGRGGQSQPQAATTSGRACDPSHARYSSPAIGVLWGGRSRPRRRLIPAARSGRLLYQDPLAGLSSSNARRGGGA